MGFRCCAVLTAAAFLAASPALATADLAKAVAQRNAGRIEKAISAGASVNEPDADGRTALFHAAGLADEALVQRLLGLGAAVDARDTTGATPLMAALRSPITRLPLVQLLLEKGADVNAADKGGRTPLMEAVLRAPRILDTAAQTALVEHLLAAGADPSRADASGAMAMHYAAHVGEPRRMLEILVSRAPDANAVTSSGANVVMMAAQNRQRANFDFLLGRGFRPVTVTAIGSERPALAQDVSLRANALAQDWLAQFLARNGDANGATVAYQAAAHDYDAAAAEAQRLIGLYEQEVAGDKTDRANTRAGFGVLLLAINAVSMGAGSGNMYYYSKFDLGTKLEQDERALATLRKEAADFTARAAVLRNVTSH